MTDKDDVGSDKRRHPRVSLTKELRAVQKDRQHQGRVKDISASGAAIQLDGELDDEALVELHIQDLASVTGHVVRAIDDGFAFEFESDTLDEDPFMTDVMRLHNEIKVEDY